MSGCVHMLFDVIRWSNCLSAPS